MKKSKTCPKCSSRRVGCVEHRPVGRAGRAGRPAEIPRPRLSLAHERVVFSVRDAGLVEYVCTDCGYCETYVLAPERIPWDRFESFRWLNDEAPSEGPFR